MGASTSFRTYPDSLGRDGIQKRWNEAVEDSLHEDGHSYSGEIGMLGKRIKWMDKELGSEDEANDLITDKHDKGDDPMAVSYMDGDKKMWLIGGWCSS